MTWVDDFLANILRKLVTFYQIAISPLLLARCRFYPTCSSYALEAIRLHGGIKGGKFAIKRICRCHPWGGFGVDFVPLPLYRYQYDYILNLPQGYVIYRY